MGGWKRLGVYSLGYLMMRFLYFLYDAASEKDHHASRCDGDADTHFHIYPAHQPGLDPDAVLETSAKL